MPATPAPAVTVMLADDRPITTNAMALDRAIATYLPNSVGGLQDIVRERTGESLAGANEVFSLLAFLAMLDDFPARTP